jgi:hypothetical protein
MAPKKWPWIVGGLIALALLAGVALVGSVAYLALRHLEVRNVQPASAEKQFEDIRSRFEGQEPMIDFEAEGWGHPIIHSAPADAEPRPLHTLHVLAFNRRDGKLVRLDLPFWLLRLKSDAGVLRLPSRDFVELERMELRAEEIEKHGPGLLMDHEGRAGERILLWVE